MLNDLMLHGFLVLVLSVFQMSIFMLFKIFRIT